MRPAPVSVSVSLPGQPKEAAYAVMEPGSNRAVSIDGLQERVFATVPAGAPEASPLDPPDKQTPIVADAKAARQAGSTSWASASPFAKKLTSGQQRWLDKLRSGDLSGVDVDPKQYLDL